MKSKKLRPEFLGTFNFESKVIITDPCYSRGTWCAAYDIEISPGNYECTAYVATAEQTGWGERVARLNVKRYGSTTMRRVRQSQYDIGVDSGQCGIFNDSTFPVDKTGEYGDDSFYGRACRATDGPNGRAEENWHHYTMLLNDLKKDLENPEYAHNAQYIQKGIDNIKAKIPASKPHNVHAGIITEGVVSRSGFGDGGYTAIFGYDVNDKVTEIEIIYIDTNELG